jgi:hypothetical protein
MSISAVSGGQPQPVALPAPVPASVPARDSSDANAVIAAAEMARHLSALVNAAAGRLDVRV